MAEARIEDCIEDVTMLVRQWLDTSANAKAGQGAWRLAEVVRDQRGHDFVLDFIDHVIRPEDHQVAARNLERLSRKIPDVLAWYLRGAVAFGGGFASMARWAIIPSARRVLRRIAGHLVIDSVPEKLGTELARLRSRGDRVTATLLEDPDAGDDAADRRIQATVELLRRDDVDAVSIALSALVPNLSLWAFDETVRTSVERLIPIFRIAAASTPQKLITFDAERSAELDLLVAVFRTIMDRDEFAQLTAGVTLQAYLPETLGVLDEITEWAQDRRSRGGAPVRVRLVKGAGLATERVEAVVRAWPLATWHSKQDTDTAFLRMLDAALTPERTDAVTVSVASHNLFDLATAHVLATQRGIGDRVGFETLLGMVGNQLAAIRGTLGPVSVLAPIVHPDRFDSAIGYLVRRLQEISAPGGFAADAFVIGSDGSVFERERDRHRAAVDALAGPAPRTFRVQDRTSPPGPPALRAAFRNAGDTDPAVATNRAWAADVLSRVPRSSLGAQSARKARVVDRARLERILASTAQAGVNWGLQDAADRAELLDLIGHALEIRRGDFIEVMVSEVALTFTDADAEVTQAIDLAHYYADSARRLADVADANFVSPRLTIVVSPWVSPLVTPTSGVLAALAAGSGVVLKPAREALRIGSLLADVLWDAGVPHSLFSLVDIDDPDLGRHLIAHPAVDRVILTGTAETATTFRWWRAGLPLTAGTNGKNAIVVTPSADLDLAVADVVRSAFGRAGQHCAAASLVILVGSVGETDRFTERLAAVTRSVRVAWPDDPGAQAGPVIREPNGALRSALTELGPGETWLVKPAQLDDSGRLWSPGIRDGVRPGSAFHHTEYLAPVLGIMRAETLDEAIAIQNAPDSGLSAGIHSLDADEVAVWLDRVEAGNLAVNRDTVRSVVQRQPFGGWKRSAVGTGTKSGGPLYVATLGRWEPSPRVPAKSIGLDGVLPRAAALIEASRSGLTFEEFAQVRAGALSDAAAREREFGRSYDPAGLVVERNVVRYRPQSVIVRAGERAEPGDVIRVLAAATAARAHVLLSVAEPLPEPLVELFGSARSPLAVVDHTVESDDEWLVRAASGAIFREHWSTPDPDEPPSLESVLAPVVEQSKHTVFGGPGSRIRLIAGDAVALDEALGASIDVAVYDGPVVDSGLIEMLPFLREQSVSMTAHRFGTPDPAFQRLRV